MPKRVLTIKDIAKLSGVSPTAVSFVLNGKNGISQNTRDKVNAIIEETGFQPSLASRRLSSKKSFNIAVVHPKSASPFIDLFYHEITSGIYEQTQKEGYNLVFTELKGDMPPYRLPEIVCRRDADGVVFLQGAQPSLLDEMDEIGIPYVLVDLHSPDTEHTHVSLDCETAICTAVNYLISQGHKKIGFMSSDKLPSYFLRCFSGYQRAISDSELIIYPDWVCKDAYDESSTGQALDRLLKARESVTAVCCTNDLQALYAMKAAKERNISLPQELSFISIDDILLSRFADPALTTITFNNQGMGRCAAKLLLSKITGESVESVIMSSTDLVIRKSVASLL